MTGTNSEPIHRRLSESILKALAFFVILEPVWMLLPFAGFLYGSVMQIETLSKNPYTALLVHFVFPVHTLFPLGIVLILTGLIIFLLGAIRIYIGKISKKGLIRTGIYRHFRHPQYLALAVFGLGIILTWGRLISFIAYFIMLWLYYLLAQSEERRCRKLFGDEYDDYRAKTNFLFPGEERLLAPFRRLFPASLPAWARICASFCLVLTLATVSGLLIVEARAEFRNTLPVITADYSLPGHNPAGVPLLLVKGPALQAAPVDRIRDDFMENSLKMVLSSGRLRSVLEKIDLGENSTLLAFPTPGSNWYSTSHRNHQQAEVNFFIFCVKSPAPYRGDNFREFRRHWQISRLIRVADMSYGRLQAGLDPVKAQIKTERFKPRMEERIDFFLSGL